MTENEPTGLRREPPLRPWRHLQWRSLALAGGVGLLAVAIAIAFFLRWIAATTPGPEDIRQAQAATPSVLVSADGQTLARLSDDLHEPVALDRIAPTVVQALIATEDQRFYQHGGLDVRRLFGAAWHSLWGPVEGGSTITQQLARNLFPDDIGRERSLLRKLREMVVALRLEKLYTKSQILTAYLNTAPFLYNVSGIEMAARTYFGKPAAELDTLESATLVGMLKGAYYYDPTRYPERARQRRNLVLGQMARRGELTAAAYDGLREQPLTLQFQRLDTQATAAPHFVAYARRQLEAWADQNDRDLYRDGLVVETTLDTRLQAVAERAVTAQADGLQRLAATEWSQKSMPALANLPDKDPRTPFAWFWRDRGDLLDAALRDTPEYRKLRKTEGDDGQALQKIKADSPLVERVMATKTRLEAGFVALEPQTGAVKVWVGSRDFAKDQFDHVAQARRQPGSTFKAFVYGAALQAGMPEDQTFVDQPVTITLPNGQVWEPTDMGGATGMTMTMREGLAQSKNSITAQVMQQTGLPPIIDFARAAGVQSPLEAVPSLALGTSAVSLLEMAGAYGTLASLGDRRDPTVIRRITDRQGRVVADFMPMARLEAIPRPIASRLIDLMRDVVLGGTASTLRSRFGIRSDVAGKTGTTQNNTDGWFLAMQPGLVSGAWVGFNDQRVRIRSDYWGQGSHSALLIVGDFLREATKQGLVDAKARFPVERVQPLPTLQPMPQGPVFDTLWPPNAPTDGPEAPPASMSPAMLNMQPSSVPSVTVLPTRP